MSEYGSRSSSPKSRSSYTGDLLLQDEWRETQSEEDELHLPAQHLSDIKSMWTEMKRDSDELRSHILPEILSALRGLKAENATFIKARDPADKHMHRDSSPLSDPSTSPLVLRCPNPHLVSVHRLPRGSLQHILAMFSSYRSVLCEQLTRQMGDFTLSHRLEQTRASGSHRATLQRSSQPAEAVHYYEDNSPIRNGDYSGEREFHLPQATCDYT